MRPKNRVRCLSNLFIDFQKTCSLTVKSLSSRVLTATNKILAKVGVKIARVRSVYGYLEAKDVIENAKKANVSVCEYLERQSPHETTAREVIVQLQKRGVFEKTPKSVLEIGAGSGRYLSNLIEAIGNTDYQIYEPASDWSNWLAQTYSVKNQPCDGSSLAATNSESIDFVHANGVFVYINFLTTYQYFQEMIRVARPGSWIVFDVISENCLSDEQVTKWIESSFDFPAFLSRVHIENYFVARGCKLEGSFLSKLAAGSSEYLIFKKAL